jgi:hypothetical protein
MTGIVGADRNALSVALAIYRARREAGRWRYRRFHQTLLAAMCWEAGCPVELVKRRASSTEAKLASLDGVTTREDGAFDGVAGGAGLATVLVVATLWVVLGSPMVVRPIAIPPMRINIAAAACSQGWLDPRDPDESASRMRPSDLARAAMVRQSFSGSCSRQRSAAMI